MRRASKMPSLEAPADKSITSLFVGGVEDPFVTKQDLQDYFYQFGEIRTINVLKKQKAAFVHFTRSVCALATRPETATSPCTRNSEGCVCSTHAGMSALQPRSSREGGRRSLQQTRDQRPRTESALGSSAGAKGQGRRRHGPVAHGRCWRSPSIASSPLYAAPTAGHGRRCAPRIWWAGCSTLPLTRSAQNGGTVCGPHEGRPRKGQEELRLLLPGRVSR